MCVRVPPGSGSMPKGHRWPAAAVRRGWPCVRAGSARRSILKVAVMTRCCPSRPRRSAAQLAYPPVWRNLVRITCTSWYSITVMNSASTHGLALVIHRPEPDQLEGGDDARRGWGWPGGRGSAIRANGRERAVPRDLAANLGELLVGKAVQGEVVICGGGLAGAGGGAREAAVSAGRT